MADNQSFWGIDIGQAGLKAIRLRYAEAAGQAIAIAYDYVPHPKILSQPDANPDELIPQALETFLSRNDVEGDLIAISVPGQSSLARFIQLPPVEKSKVAEIVKYEAKQQIPFDLDDVVWDYQTLGGGIEEGGFMLEAEVGLFAMKKEEVANHLQPFIDRNIEVELIQTGPLALYNMLTYDKFGGRPDSPAAEQSEYTILCDMGVDNTTLLVTNGKKIWLRNVPIGGNHFTRALTKQMKLTFAKAEHLKINATKSPDPRAVFQALRPVFNDYVAEIQRSIGYFSSVNRDAVIGKVIGLGNGFKLAGLQKFLQQNLQYDVEKVDSFKGLVGDNVLHAPLFEENILTFAVPYGLALQLMEQTPITTTLLPPEIISARKVRAKKPWAVLSAAMLLLAMSISAFGYAGRNKTVGKDKFGAAEQNAKNYKQKVDRYKQQFADFDKKYDDATQEEKNLLTPLQNRNKWLELLKTINVCLPRNEGNQNDNTEITGYRTLKISSITTERVEDVAKWFKGLPANQKSLYMAKSERKSVPKGYGYIVTLDGSHFYEQKTVKKDETEKNNDSSMKRIPFVHNTLLKNLQRWTLSRKGSPTIDVRKMGISHALIVNAEVDGNYRYWKDGRKSESANKALAGRGGPMGQGGFSPDDGADISGKSSIPVKKAVEGVDYEDVDRTLFKVQFLWQPVEHNERKPKSPEQMEIDGETPEEQ